MADDDGSLAVIIPAMDPDLDTLAWTLERVGAQDYPVEEVVIVDSSERPIDAINSDAVNARVMQEPGMGIGEARRAGMESVDTQYVAHIDTDTIFLTETYFSEAIERLQDPAVAAAGGTTYPLDGNIQGRAIALFNRFNPTTLSTYNLVFERRLCSEGACFFPGQGRGEDITMRDQLKQFGRIEQMSGQTMGTEMPTERQGLIRDVVVGTITGAVAGAVSGYARDFLRDVGEDAREQVEEDLS